MKRCGKHSLTSRMKIGYKTCFFHRRPNIIH